VIFCLYTKNNVTLQPSKMVRNEIASIHAASRFPPEPFLTASPPPTVPTPNPASGLPGVAVVVGATTVFPPLLATQQQSRNQASELQTSRRWMPRRK
jgi:hypothetical protein